jgi:hypothetical protein
MPTPGQEVTRRGVQRGSGSFLMRRRRKREQSYYLREDGRRLSCSRALVPTVLSRYISIDPRDWSSSANAYGRPEIANAQARNEALVFDLSYTQSRVVLAVTKGRGLRVGVEKFRARTAPIDIVDHYFASSEVAAVTAVAPSQLQYRLFRVLDIQGSLYQSARHGFIVAAGLSSAFAIRMIIQSRSQLIPSWPTTHGGGRSGNSDLGQNIWRQSVANDFAANVRA